MDLYSISRRQREGQYRVKVANQERLAAPEKFDVSFEMPSLGMAVAASALFSKLLCGLLLL